MNGGDAGLKHFFERDYGALVPGGTFNCLYMRIYLIPSGEVDAAEERADIADTARRV